VESTNEKPKGPLTLRVYAGSDCRGTLYQDDGRTYAYKGGAFLRMSFSCQVTRDGFELRAGPQEGAYPAWWTNIRVEVYGWKRAVRGPLLNSKPFDSNALPTSNGLAITIPADSNGFDLQLR
jgi:alpha-glucosidase